jgi:hypothetical protein
VSEPAITLNTELTDREVFLIGSIVSQWGFLEADIFHQTFLSFEDEDSPLPVAMNNAQFTAVLELWLERVVEKRDDARKAVLKEQYQEIGKLSAYRQALVHSRWEWRPDAPDAITAIRVHKKTIKRVTLTSEDLLQLSIRLGQIRYRIRYPGGIEDRAAELAAAGGYISRRGWELLTGRQNWDGSPRVEDPEPAP